MKEKNITEDAKIGKIREMHDFFIVPLESECAGCIFYRKVPRKPHPLFRVEMNRNDFTL
jgi:hypothetical protein